MDANDRYMIREGYVMVVLEVCGDLCLLFEEQVL